MTSADRDVNRLQHWLDTHHLQRAQDRQATGHRLVSAIRQRDVGRYTSRIVNFVEGAAISIGKALFDAVLVLVISIYMLLDMQRLARRIDRRFPPARRAPADRADRARARLLRARADRAQPDHRHERRARALGLSGSPGSCPTPTPTRSSSAAGSR